MPGAICFMLLSAYSTPQQQRFSIRASNLTQRCFNTTCGRDFTFREREGLHVWTRSPVTNGFRNRYINIFTPTLTLCCSATLLGSSRWLASLSISPSRRSLIHYFCGL